MTAFINHREIATSVAAINRIAPNLAGPAAGSYWRYSTVIPGGRSDLKDIREPFPIRRRFQMLTRRPRQIIQKLEARGDLPVIYDEIMKQDAYFDDDFKAGIVAAGARARLETLAAGVSVFYVDPVWNVDVMEEPSGRKFEIRFVPDDSHGSNYEIVRELCEPMA